MDEPGRRLDALRPRAAGHLAARRLPAKASDPALASYSRLATLGLPQVDQWTTESAPHAAFFQWLRLPHLYRDFAEDWARPPGG